VSARAGRPVVGLLDRHTGPYLVTGIHDSPKPSHPPEAGASASRGRATTNGRPMPTPQRTTNARLRRGLSPSLSGLALAWILFAHQDLPSGGRLLRRGPADGRDLQQVLEPTQVGGGPPSEQPGHQRSKRLQRAEQATLHHLIEPAAGRAGRLNQAGASQLLLPIPGLPLEQAPRLDPVDAASVRKLMPTGRSNSRVVTPSWPGPGCDGRIWVTPPRQLGSLP
jgi:hypothetical protein